MGGNEIRPDNSDHVLYAIDHGLNYVDTSPTYGNGLSEEGYGVAIKARGRDKLFVTTKVPDEATRDSETYRNIFNSLSASEQTKYRNLARERAEESGVLKQDYMVHYFAGQPKRIRDEVLNSVLAEKFADRIQRKTRYRDDIIGSVEGSLKRLGTDYLDCLLCPHGADIPYHVTNHPEVFEAFATLKRQGKVRFFGLSAHSDPAGVLSAAIDTGEYAMAMIAYNFINHRYVDEALEKAREADFGVIVMKASRGLQNPFRRSNLVQDRVKTINELVPGEDLTPFQKAFQWVLANKNISGIAAGMANMEETKQDVPLGMTEV
jgi:predicted aldo/keto reductase-like oxidoreductase